MKYYIFTVLLKGHKWGRCIQIDTLIYWCDRFTDPRLETRGVKPNAGSNSIGVLHWEDFEQPHLDPTTTIGEESIGQA